MATNPLLTDPAAAQPADPDRELATAIASLTPAQQHQLLTVIQSGDSGLAPEMADMLTKALSPTAKPAPPGGPVERFAAPIGQAIEGIAGLPEAAAGAVANPIAAGETMLVEPSMAQARKAGQALDQGRYVEAAGHAAATLPVVGPIAASIGEALGEGNVAGALGQSVVAAAPFAKAAIRPTGISAALMRRAAARELDVMRPRTAAVAGAEGVVEDVLLGVPGSRHTPGGLGVGNLDELARRAKARAKSAGKDIEALQSDPTPVDPSEVSAGLRAEADRLTTTPPPRKVFEEVRSPVLDEFGDPIVGVVEREIAGRPVSGNPALVKALEAESQFIDDLAAQYPDEKVPAGELFKQRAAIGRRTGRAYRVMPGDEAAASVAAGKSAREGLTGLLHREVPTSKIPDREYHVFRTAWTNIERHRRSKLTNRGLKGLKDLLFGRGIGMVLGATTGAALGTGAAGVGVGAFGGIAGAFVGTMLGESAYWGSLRAHTYAQLAKHLNDGDLDAAARILQSTALTYAASKAEVSRRAQKELRAQAEGVVEP